MAPYRSTSADYLLEKSLQARRGAVLNLLYPDGDEWLFVLTKRNEYIGNHSAQVSFPGGKMDETDPDLMHTSIRETAEELGVVVPITNVLGSLSPVYIPPSNFLVNPYIAFLEQKPVFLPDPREVQYIIEFPVKALLNDAIIQQTSVNMSNGSNMKVPYFAIHNEVVWGATAVILSEFRELLKEK